MKTVYVMRHGRASCDMLTEDGRVAASNTATQLNKELGGLDKVVIYHSPLSRARETAEVVAEVLSMDTCVVESQYLMCDKEKVDFAARMAEDNSILVSHAPDIESFTGRYLRPAQYVKKNIDDRR